MIRLGPKVSRRFVLSQVTRVENVSGGPLHLWTIAHLSPGQCLLVFWIWKFFSPPDVIDCNSVNVFSAD